MRLLLLLLIACAPALHAQPAHRYWIFFDGKHAAAEVDEVTDRALQRRAARGSAEAERLLTPVSAAHLAALHGAGITPRVVSRWLNAVSAELTDDQVQTVGTLPFVRGLRPVAATVPLGIQPAPAAPLVPPAAPPAYGPSARQLQTINAIAALERGFNGRGVIVGFLDTEYGDFTHPAFARMVSEGRLLATKNFAPAPQADRHGQAVASIAVGFAEGDLIGPAWGASVLAATTEYAPTETNAEEDAFVAGLEWLEAQGVDVVNVSLAYTTFDSGQRSYTVADLDGDTGVTTRAADLAASLGVVVVAAAGNDGGCGSPSPACWYYIGTPADGDSVIAVGAINPDSSKASFSSFGPASDGRVKPDVVAQGAQVRHAAGFGYGIGGGTSYSSPLVAGVAAQMLQANPRLTPMQVRDILRRTASQADHPDNRLGWGIINADRAVQEAVALAAEPIPAGVLGVRVEPHPARGPVSFVLTGSEPVAAWLQVFDVTGRLVAEPFRGTLSGTAYVSLDADLPAGLYLYRLTAAHEQASGTFLRLR